MATTEAWKNRIATLAGSDTLYASLHDDDPSTTGANEITGGSPAYARKELSWGSASSGEIAATQVTFDVPATTVKHAGIWSASTSGTFYGSVDVTDETFAAQGEYKLTVNLALLDPS